MAALLVLPPDLTPTALTHLHGFPAIIDVIIRECLAHWQQGHTDSAIRCARQAQELAEAHNHSVSISVISVLLADLYRELDQLGLALAYCQKAHDALCLQPNYEHRHHAEAVIIYLRGLLHHALGANTEALFNYQQALTSFEKAIEHWNVSTARNPTQADKCEKATRWINVLCRCLAGALSPVRGGTELHIPATSGQDYELARLKLAAYLFPPEVIISGQRYHLHYPDNGIAFDANDKLEVQWNACHFAVRVLEDQWAGAHSAQGDYILVRRERKAANPIGPGVLRDGGQQQWKYGAFTRDAEGNIWFRPFPPIVIGGAPHDEEVEEQDIGIVRALLKPT